MKQHYVKPCLEVETFEPNEYVATCYAIIDVNNAGNFVVAGPAAGNRTDGQNTGGNEKGWFFDNKGFQDDHFDYLSAKWGESPVGLFYDGPGMAHTTKVLAWEGNNDHAVGETLVEHMATEVYVKKINDKNAASYGTTTNAS